MAGILTYPELTRVDSLARIVHAYRARDFSKDLRTLYPALFLSRFSGASYRDEFWNTNLGHYPWRLDPIGLGSSSLQTTVANHPGIIRLAQNGANTGGSFWIGFASSILLQGLEQTELIFNMVATAALVIRFGFGDNFTAAAAPTDGVWIDIAGATITGKTRNNGVESTTGTSYASSAATWYHAKIALNSDASRVDYTLYNAAGAILWTDNLTTNIPRVAGRELSHGLHAYKTTAGVVGLVDLDFMNLRMPKGLSR